MVLVFSFVSLILFLTSDLGRLTLLLGTQGIVTLFAFIFSPLGIFLAAVIFRLSTV